MKTEAPVIRLVVRREVTERLRTRAFLVSTGIYLVAALATVIIPRLAGETEVVHDVGVAGAGATELAQTISQLAPILEVDVRVQQLDGDAAAAGAVRTSVVDVAVVDGSRLLAGGDVPDQLGALLNAAVFQSRLSDRLRAAGLQPGDVARLLVADQLQVDRLEERTPLRTENRGLAYAGVLAIYLLLLTYGLTVANGVLEEKSSRVCEVLLGAIRPTQLLAGKVIGIGLVALVQLLAVVVPTLLVAVALGSDLPTGAPLTFAAVLMWAALGYALYSCIFAAAGSAASRPEDVGNATAPVTILIALTYFAAIAATQDPDATVVRVASFVPPMAPMTMLPRAAVGNVASWEVPLSVALLVLTTYATVRLAARIYAGRIRRPGPKLKLRDAWRAAAS